VALSAAERAQVRTYLGWSARFHQMDSALEQAMNALDQDADSLALVQTPVTGHLARIADVDAKLLAADTTLLVDAAGTVKLDPARQVALLRSKGRMFVGRLAALLGVPVREDYFAGVAPKGPFWGMAGSHGGGLPGGGNLPSLG
jgi:hypothetical protein